MVCNSTWTWVEMSEPHREEWLTELAYRDSVEKWVCVKDALAATAASVAQHAASVERRGAAKELRRAAADRVADILSWSEASGEEIQEARFVANWLEARAAELEGA